MKYEKSFKIADLSFDEVGYECPSIEGVINDIASRYKREVDINTDILPNIAADLRLAVETAMCDSLDAFVSTHDDADPNMIIRADAVYIVDAPEDNYSAVITGYTLESDSPVTLSIARELFASFDADEINAAVEDEFLDLLIRRVKKCGKRSTESKPTNDTTTSDAEITTMIEAFANEIPAHDPELDDIEEVEAEEVEIEDDEIEEVDYDDEAIEREAEAEANEAEAAEAEAEVEAEVAAEGVPTPSEAKPEPTIAKTDPTIANLVDPQGLMKRYKSHFLDVCSIPDIANAKRNVMTREGNYIVLTSTIIKEDGYKLETVTRYDAKNAGKSCRTTENDGNKTNVWSWRTPSLYGWALATLPEDGGDFDDDVLSKSLVEKGPGSCKAWGIRFIPTPKGERNRNRGNNGANNGANATTEPKAEPKAEPKVETSPEPKVEPKVEPIVETTPEPTVEPTVEPEILPTNAEGVPTPTEADPEPSDAIIAADPSLADDHADADDATVADVTDATTADDNKNVETWSKSTRDFLLRFKNNSDFRDEIMKLVADKQHEAERAKAEEEARAKKGKGRAKHKMFDPVMRRMKHGKPAYVYGPAGTGKNVLAEQIAEALGIPFAPINCLFEKFEVTGFAKPDGALQETTIYLAVKYGWMLFWDEADTSAPQAGNVMNSLLANGYIDFPVVGRVYAHPNFRCIAAGNTNGRGCDSEYTGRTTLDAATLNRFKLFKVDYDYNVEVAICKKRGYDEQPAEFVEDFRQAVRACGLQHLVSYRQLDDMLDDLDDELPIEDAILESIVRDMPDDDFRIVSQQLRQARNKYSAACRRMSDKYSAAV